MNPFVLPNKKVREMIKIEKIRAIIFVFDFTIFL